ncbi:hypothetical protein SAMN02745823_03738 [Sporobacter termitidis DSM 10068]|uniref:Uncharacterized protein n=1 Tax=Sporobacter termitidis DSM 10068 TaxID=1123282 RepID=A0A1M5ZH79_9FIRM|nr:hypothetical protein [Sporobacter termitidis]SHI23558.1 hypothetical protein SAMN02745823_03738 [Sporobacter termitidis DSM 10068]
MSPTRITFIIVCIILAVMVFTIGLIIRRGGDDSGMTVSGLLSPSGAKRKKRRARPKNASVYFTVVLTLTAIALLIIFSGR